MRTLRGKVVLVTGAASGIGRSLAMQFAEAGSLVLITDVDGDRAVSVAALRGVLPRPVFDAVARVFGVSGSMVSWRGRGTKAH